MAANGIADIPVLHPNTEAELAAAARIVLARATGPADELELLGMLGLTTHDGALRKPIAHGTYRGVKQHYYRGEPMCADCRGAERAYQAERRKARKTARQNGGAR